MILLANSPGQFNAPYSAQRPPLKTLDSSHAMVSSSHSGASFDLSNINDLCIASKEH
jgi:hypothetical protein